MTGIRVEWRVRRASGDVVIKLHPADPGVDDVEASVREIAHLVYDLRGGDPEARRVLLDVHARLCGLSSSAVRDEALALDTGSTRAAAIGAELLRAAQRGVLVAERIQSRSVVVPLTADEEDALGPQSTPPPDWVGFQVLDDPSNAPVSGVKLAVTLPDGSKTKLTTGDDGTALIKQTPNGFCSVVFDDDNLTSLQYPASGGTPQSFATGVMNPIYLKKLILQLLYLYHDDRPVVGADFTVVLVNGQQVKGTLDANGQATVVLPAPADRVQYGPDSRDWNRVDQTKNPDFADDIDPDSFVAQRFAADDAGQS